MKKLRKIILKCTENLENQFLPNVETVKKKQFQDLFLKIATNIKNTWAVNQVYNINNNTKQQPTSLLINNKLISVHKEITETFNNYLSSVASKLVKSIIS